MRGNKEAGCVRIAIDEIIGDLGIMEEAPRIGSVGLDGGSGGEVEVGMSDCRESGFNFCNVHLGGGQFLQEEAREGVGSGAEEERTVNVWLEDLVNGEVFRVIEDEIGDGSIEEFCRGEIPVLPEEADGSPFPLTVGDGDLLVETLVEKEHTSSRSSREALSRGDNDQEKSDTEEQRHRCFARQRKPKQAEGHKSSPDCDENGCSAKRWDEDEASQETSDDAADGGEAENIPRGAADALMYVDVLLEADGHGGEEAEEDAGGAEEECGEDEGAGDRAQAKSHEGEEDGDEHVEHENADSRKEDDSEECAESGAAIDEASAAIVADAECGKNHREDAGECVNGIAEVWRKNANGEDFNDENTGAGEGDDEWDEEPPEAHETEEHG